jgi:iron complex transport system substrate-binding protein
MSRALAKAALLAMAAALVAALVVACSRRPAPPAPSAAAARVVSLSPATTEALFAIGAGPSVVGRSRYCDFPPEAARVPVVGSWVDADLESILQLAPDLVVGSVGPSAPGLARSLGARGIATWFPPVESIDAIHSMIVGLGDRTGHAAEARRVAGEMVARAEAVERAVAAEPAPRVLAVVGVDPVVAAGPGSFIDELVRRARGADVLAAGGAWQVLGLERLVELDPDVILDASFGMGGAPVPITKAWATLRAVREGHVVPLDARVPRPGPRVVESLTLIARALHPNVALSDGGAP